MKIPANRPKVVLIAGVATGIGERVAERFLESDCKVHVCDSAKSHVSQFLAATQVPEPTLPFFQMMYKDLTVRTIIVYAMPEDAKKLAIDDIDTALASAALQHRIAHTLPLDEIVQSNEIIERGRVRGAVVLTNPQE